MPPHSAHDSTPRARPRGVCGVRAAAVCVRLHSLAPVGLDDAAHVIDGRVDDLVAEGLDQAAAHLVRARARARVRVRVRARARARARARVRVRGES